MKNFCFFIAFLFAACLQMLGQELKVASFSIVANDLSASIEQKMDLNGMPCALVKVLVLDKISGVEGNIIGNAIDKGTEKWIYLTSGSKEVKIKTENFFPLHLIFSHYGITALEAKHTYVLTLTALNESNMEVPLNLKDPEDQVLMGLKYENGSEVKRDFKKAFSLYQKSAKQGYPEGMFKLGECYLYSRGVKENIGKALYWFTQSANKGDAQAQRELAILYEEGKTVEKNEKEAIKYYKKSVAQEDVTAMTYLAFHYLEGDCGLAKDYSKAIELLNKAKNKGDAEVFGFATKLLADCYRDGTGVTQDFQKAFSYYKEVEAKYGGGDLKYELGRCYELGRGVTKNINEALEYYQKAASFNNKSALLHLGILLPLHPGIKLGYLVNGC